MLVLAALIAVIASAFLTVLLVPVVRALALRVGFVDVPAGRKIHHAPMPLGGGVAILLAILLPSLLVLTTARIWAVAGIPAWVPEAIRIHISGLAMRSGEGLTVLAGAVLLCILGIIDDRGHLGPWVKLLAQAAVAIGTVWLADLRVLTMAGEPISFIASVLWMLVIVNAMNFLDNMDGLSAGVTLICACALLAAAAGMGQIFVSIWVCMLIGTTAAFLLFNFPPARIFMGDAGSLVLGYMLAVLSMLTTYYSGEASGKMMYRLLAPLLLLAVPLYDFASVVTIRLREKRNPMVGDTRHFSHRLVRRGMSVRYAVLTIYLCTAVTGIAAILLPHVNDLTAVLLAVQTLGVLGIIALLESAEPK